MNISEQRKEIASRLRNPDSLNSEGCIITAGICLKISSTLIANLIDPTCNDFGGEEGTNGEGYDFACSACGWCGDVCEPNYCPNCGARVVDYVDGGGE